MSTATNATTPTIAKIRTILGLDGITGQAGEVVINLSNQPGSTPKLFQSATVSVEGAYSVSVSTEDTFFLSMRPDGNLLVHVGPNTGTVARFMITRVDGFEYALTPRETRYIFAEEKPAGETRLSVLLKW